jgi:hypothetical protein
MFEDSRRTFFDDIRTDGAAVLDVSFMQLPVVEIDAGSGRLRDDARTSFDNTFFGVIMVAADGTRRATYLPGVYGSATSWKSIRDSVSKKAAGGGTAVLGSDDGAARYYAYRTAVRSMQLLELLYAPETTRTLVSAFCQTLLDGYRATRFVPYAVTNKGTFTVDSDSDVRNVSTVVAGLAFNRAVFKSASLRDFLNKDASAFRDHVDDLSDQALAFLMPVLGVGRAAACQRLAKRLPDAEQVFERGELSRALALYCNTVHGMQVRAASQLTSVFQWNWESQALAASRALHGDVRTSYGRWVLHWFSGLAVQHQETNNLAVFLESVGLYIASANDDDDDEDENIQANLTSAALRAFLELLTRWHHGIFFFHNGSSARMDITVHVLNGVTGRVNAK